MWILTVFYNFNNQALTGWNYLINRGKTDIHLPLMSSLVLHPDPERFAVIWYSDDVHGENGAIGLYGEVWVTGGQIQLPEPTPTQIHYETSKVISTPAGQPPDSIHKYKKNPTEIFLNLNECYLKSTKSTFAAQDNQTQKFCKSVPLETA